MKLTYFNKLDIINSIKALNKSQQQCLFKFLYKNLNLHNYSTNRNGVFINFNTLSDEDYYKIDNYIKNIDIEKEQDDDRSKTLDLLKSTLNNSIVKENKIQSIVNNYKKEDKKKKNTISLSQLKIWNDYKDPSDNSSEIDVDKLINNYNKYNQSLFKKSTLYKYKSKAVKYYKQTESYFYENKDQVENENQEYNILDSIETSEYEEILEDEEIEEDVSSESNSDASSSSGSILDQNELNDNDYIENFKKLLISNGLQIDNMYLDYEEYLPLIP
jgi:hypothetical protein